MRHSTSRPKIVHEIVHLQYMQNIKHPLRLPASVTDCSGTRRYRDGQAIDSGNADGAAHCSRRLCRWRGRSGRTHTCSARHPKEELAEIRQSTYDNGSYGDGYLLAASGADVAEAGDASGMSRNIQPNPWGCRIYADHPHESGDNPGPGHIQGKGRITCTTTPPPNVANIWQELSRWEGSDSVIMATNNSLCPARVGNPRPECYPNLYKKLLMRAFVNIACEVGKTYRWVHIAEGVMIVEGVRYSGLAGSVRTEKCTGE